MGAILDDLTDKEGQVETNHVGVLDSSYRRCCFNICYHMRTVDISLQIHLLKSFLFNKTPIFMSKFLGLKSTKHFKPLTRVY